MVNWNSRLAKQGDMLPGNIEIKKVRHFGNVIVLTVQLVNLPPGVTSLPFEIIVEPATADA